MFTLFTILKKLIASCDFIKQVTHVLITRKFFKKRKIMSCFMRVGDMVVGWPHTGQKMRNCV